MIRRLREYLRQHRRSRTVRNIRSGFAAVGHDLSDRTDEEIEAAALAMAGKLYAVGLHPDEAKAVARCVVGLGAKAVARCVDGLGAEDWPPA